MILCIAGGRNINPPLPLLMEILLIIGFVPYTDTIIEGGATGVDLAAKNLAKCTQINHIQFPAKWDDLKAPGAVIKSNSQGLYNAKAGHDRNELMANKADILLLIWDGSSKGSFNMLVNALNRNKPVYEIVTQDGIKIDSVTTHNTSLSIELKDFLL